MKKEFEVIERSGRIVVNESQEHEQRRLASFYLHLKVGVLSFVIINIIWLISRLIVESHFKCSGVKTLSEVCPCDDGGLMRGIESLRFYSTVYVFIVLTLTLQLFKVARMRHGRLILLEHQFSMFASSTGGGVSVALKRAQSVRKSAAHCTDHNSDLPNQSPQDQSEEHRTTSPVQDRQENGNDGDSDPPDRAFHAQLWGPFATNHICAMDVAPLPPEGVRIVLTEVLILGCAYALVAAVLAGVMGLAMAMVGVAMILISTWRFKRLAQRIVPGHNYKAVFRPIWFFMMGIMVGGIILGAIIVVLESKPEYATIIVTVFPMGGSLVEWLFMDVMGPRTVAWSDEDASLLARLGVQFVEVYRVGALLSAATLLESSATHGPFFNSLVAGIITDILVRNDVFSTLKNKILHRRSDSSLVVDRCRFVMVYIGVKTDACYVVWITVVMFKLHNWGPSPIYLGCGATLYPTYGPPASIVLAGIVGEIATDVGGHAFRLVLARIRPLWVVPLYHVAPEGSIALRVTIWLAMYGVVLTALGGAAVSASVDLNSTTEG